MSNPLGHRSGLIPTYASRDVLHHMVMKMTNRYIYLLLSILLTNCSNTKEHSLEGLWQYCGYEGEYEELLIIDSLVIHMMIIERDFEEGFPDDTKFYSSVFGSYRYHDDSMKIDRGNEIYNKNSTELIKQHLNFITADQIELQPVLDRRMNKLILTRIKNYTFPPFDSDKKKEWWDTFSAEMEERMMINQCPDLRTKEEVLQDSIDGINNSVILSEQSEDFEDLFDIDSYLKSEKDSIK